MQTYDDLFSVSCPNAQQDFSRTCDFGLPKRIPELSRATAPFGGKRTGPPRKNFSPGRILLTFAEETSIQSTKGRIWPSGPFGEQTRSKDPWTMNELNSAVARVRRRLWLQRFLVALAWSWAAVLLGAGAVILGQWYFLGETTPGGVFAGALGLGVLVAAVASWWRTPRTLAAAVELDLRFGLQERISSAWALLQEKDPDHLAPAEQAVVEDALYHLKRVDVAAAFPVRAGRWLLAPVLPGLLAAALVLWLPPWEQKQAQADLQTAQQVQKQIQQQARQLRRQAKKQREKLARQGLKQAEKWLRELEKGLQELEREKPKDRQKALAKLNNLRRQLQQRRRQLGSAKALRQQLARLRGLNQDPLRKLVQAMRQGDLKKAIEQLKKLKQQIAQGQLSEQEKKKLLEQVQKLQQKLQQMAQARQKQIQQLEKQIQQAQAAGQHARAQQLRQQLEQLLQQQAAMQPVEQMSRQLAQALQQLQQGQQQQALQSLQQALEQLQQLQQQMAEAQALEQMLDQLQACKQGMCQGQGMAGNNGGQGQRPGDGLGRGAGIGFRPEEKTQNNRFVDTKARVEVRRGSALVTGKVVGPNIKGQVRDRVQQQYQAAKTEEASPLSNQRLPKNYRRHAKEYFDALRQGR